MRKNTRLFRQITSILKKVERLYLAGRPRAINFEIAGKRYGGKDMENLAFSDQDVKFFIGDEHFTIKHSEIVNVKRLRTRKFMFYVERTVEETSTPKKKTSAKKAKAEKETENSSKGE